MKMALATKTRRTEISAELRLVAHSSPISIYVEGSRGGETNVRVLGSRHVETIRVQVAESPYGRRQCLEPSRLH
jgi:hypothetical protein